MPDDPLDTGRFGAAWRAAHEPQAPDPAAAEPPSAPGEVPGDVIDRYTLVERIGEGGMGTVWRAEQSEPVRREVALKIIKLGMDTREVVVRFEAERQALALMDHPHIATVLDGGATAGGRPYFVMELVQGTRITEHCDRARLGLRERLRLFVEVCGAIQHAHQKGIIHRDIKPSNVLIADRGGEAVPMVIDFGIAKATSAELTQKTLVTREAQVIGTPEYMAPEQAEGAGVDVDTRADVYSLGVLLYELLTGTVPFGLDGGSATGYLELLRSIREVDPAKPSTRISTLGESATPIAARRHVNVEVLRNRLRGDLDWIVMKALEKDRARRYETASALAADVGRTLNGEAVVAAPPSTAYRLRKFVGRNRAAVLVASSIAALLVLGVVGTSIGLVRARDAAAVATHEAGRATEVKRFVEGMLGSVDPEVAQGRDTTLMREILEDAEARLEAGEIADELIEAELRALIGRTYLGLGAYEQAERFLLRALALQRRASGEDAEATLLTKSDLGRVLLGQGRLSEAEATSQEVLATRSRDLGAEHPDTLAAQSDLGAVLQAQGRWAEARPLYRTALELRRRALGDEHPATLRSMDALASLLHGLGEERAAERMLRDALAIRRRVLGNEHPQTLVSVNNLGDLLLEDGDYEGAEALYREALDTRRRVLGDEHPATLRSLSDMGDLLYMVDRMVESEPYYREALEVRRRSLGEEHPDTLRSKSDVGELLAELGQFAEAEPFLQAALDGRRRVLGDDHPATLWSFSDMGYLKYERGLAAESVAFHRVALEGRRRVLGASHLDTVTSLSDLAHVLAGLGEDAEAEGLAHELVAARRVEVEDPGDLGTALLLLGCTLLRQGERAEAAAAFEEGAADFEAAAPRELLQRSLRRVAALYDAQHALEPDAGHDERATAWRARLAE